MKKAILCSTILLVICSWASDLRSAVYSVTSVGPINAQAVAINNSGQVAGWSGMSAFVWEGTNTYPIAVDNLVEVRGLNSAGYVVGLTTNGGFIGHYGDATTYLAAPEGGARTINGINDSNVAVGRVMSDLGVENAFSYNISTTTTTLLAGTEGSASAINNSGTIVGQYRSTAGDYPYAIHAARFNGSSGPVSDLGTLGNSDYVSSATAINANGRVVGYSQTPGPGGVVAGPFHAFLRTDAGMIDLGALGALTESYANAINIHDQVVGRSGDNKAFLWRNATEGMMDLNTLIPTGSGWVLHEATGINDSGQIVGLGTYTYSNNGVPTTENRAFLLTIPEPSTLVLLAAGAMGILAWAWRRRRS